MSLRKDDVVELLQKDDNGWWLVKKDGAEGWAPNNYLELVPPQAAAPAVPPPPPRKAPAPKAPAASLVAAQADVNAKPVSVFPGMGPSNGSAAPWKKTAVSNASADSSPTGSRPGSAHTKVPPPIANKPKPAPPPVGAKPGVGGKVGGRPPIPAAARPAPTTTGTPARVAHPAGVPGQVDLAAAVSGFFFCAFFFCCLFTERSLCCFVDTDGPARTDDERRGVDRAIGRNGRG